jgi:hypothetical protein
LTQSIQFVLWILWADDFPHCVGRLDFTRSRTFQKSVLYRRTDFHSDVARPTNTCEPGCLFRSTGVSSVLFKNGLRYAKAFGEGVFGIGDAARCSTTVQQESLLTCVSLPISLLGLVWPWVAPILRVQLQRLRIWVDRHQPFKDSCGACAFYFWLGEGKTPQLYSECGTIAWKLGGQARFVMPQPAQNPTLPAQRLPNTHSARRNASHFRQSLPVPGVRRRRSARMSMSVLRSRLEPHLYSI